jgi:hypothetical protein
LQDRLGSAEKPWTFACPEPGSRLTGDDGRSLDFTGTDPAKAGVCIARAGASPVRLPSGMAGQSTSEDRGHISGMASLFPAGTGTNATQASTVRYWLEGVPGILLQPKVELGLGGSSLLGDLRAAAG